MATIVHFDLSAEDTERAKTFYETLFSWKFKLLPEPIDYYLIETKDLKGKKGIGGVMDGRDKQVGIINYIGVASIDDAIREVKRLGGKIVEPKQVVPDWGYTAVCKDTEENTFGLFQAY